MPDTFFLVGSGAREHALAGALVRSGCRVVVWATHGNPGLLECASEVRFGNLSDSEGMAAWAQKKKVDIAVVGPEEPLAMGVSDALEQAGIPCIGPSRRAAEIETSKSFARRLLVDAQIPVYPRFFQLQDKGDIAATMREAAAWIAELGSAFVVKPDGLTGGKGVKVQGDHFDTNEEGLAYARQCLESNGVVLLEEKLVGQEFSLMSFCDGKNLVHMPVVQDNKRLLPRDKGPNTGGMGSVSDANHRLPFLTDNDIRVARETNQRVIDALRNQGRTYKGILYGNYIAVRDGIKLIEYNARFGDPEALNVLSLLESDFGEICRAIAEERISAVPVRFARKATVCKYVVPRGYPERPIKGETVSWDPSLFQAERVRAYIGAIEEQDGRMVLTGSRAIGVVGIADTIAGAERIAEQAVQAIQGPVQHRHDIGTEDLMRTRIESMRLLRES